MQGLQIKLMMDYLPTLDDPNPFVVTGMEFSLLALITSPLEIGARVLPLDGTLLGQPGIPWLKMLSS